jgi:tetratricopeptide (TPR) repeat protein
VSIDAFICCLIASVYTVSPPGTFDSDSMLATLCRPHDQPEDWLDDNLMFVISQSHRSLVAEALEAAGMYTEAIAQLEPSLSFNLARLNPNVNARDKAMLGRLYASLGKTNLAAACFDDALKTSRDAEQLLTEYHVAKQMKAYLLDKGESPEARSRGDQQVAEVRTKLKASPLLESLDEVID